MMKTAERIAREHKHTQDCICFEGMTFINCPEYKRRLEIVASRDDEWELECRAKEGASWHGGYVRCESDLKTKVENKIMMHTHTVGDPPCTRCDINRFVKNLLKELFNSGDKHD